MAALETPVCDFGRAALDFDLPGCDGRRWTLEDIRGSRATLIMFICNHCPYVRAVIDRLVQVTDELSEHGVLSLAIMPNDIERSPTDSFDHMRRFADEHAFGFPYVIDETQDVARAYDAVCTPDFFGYNSDLELQYRGRLDPGRLDPPSADDPRELFDAMLQIAQTGHGPVEQTPSIGCSIKWRVAV